MLTPYTSAVNAVNKEQLVSTVARISCWVSGLTRQLDGVKWTKSDGSTITSNQDGYTITEGVFLRGSRVTTLIVDGRLNTQDTTYTCLLSSREHGLVDKGRDVSLKVFCE